MWPFTGGKDFDFLLRNSLFGAAKLTRNADFNEYKYSIYGTGFDARSFSLSNGSGFGKNVKIFSADMSSAVIIKIKLF